MAGTDRGSALFPANDARIETEDRLTACLIAARERIASASVTPTIDLLSFRKQLSAFDFNAPLPLDEVLQWTAAQLQEGIVQITHNRYFGLFNPNPTFPAQCADRIANAFNPQLASSKTSPVPVEIEAHVIAALAGRLGLPAAATGHFTSGGSEANLTALICALTAANGNFAADGARAFPGSPAFYVSRESHLAWIKIAHETGIGRNAVRLIATDGTGRMDTCALAKAIGADRDAGCVPIMAVATAGTTGAGMVDPLHECEAVARQNGLWFHVDAAWGGAAAVSDLLRPILAGIERADSITIDAHKWLAATMGCGMFFCSCPAALPAAFGVANSFMTSYIPSLDPYVSTAQWSRRFLGLRLFTGLAAAGWEGYAGHVERAVALAAYAKDLLEEGGWQIVNASPLAVLCILPPNGGASVEDIAGRVLASGQAWISVAAFEGRKVLRACITNGETAERDVEALVSALFAASKA